MLKIRHYFLTMFARLRRYGQSKARSVEDETLESPIPASSLEAHARLRNILDQGSSIGDLSKEEFILGWVAMACISPGLDPYDVTDENGGWPPGWRIVAAEALRRYDAKELTKEELCPVPVSLV